MALHPAPTLADLRKTSESLSRWVQTINHAEADVCAHAIPEAQTSADARPDSRAIDECRRNFAPVTRRSVPSVSGAIWWSGEVPRAEALLEQNSGLAYNSPCFPELAAFQVQLVWRRRPVLLAAVGTSFQSRACRVEGEGAGSPNPAGT